MTMETFPGGSILHRSIPFRAVISRPLISALLVKGCDELDPCRCPARRLRRKQFRQKVCVVQFRGHVRHLKPSALHNFPHKVHPDVDVLPHRLTASEPDDCGPSQPRQGCVQSKAIPPVRQMSSHIVWLSHVERLAECRRFAPQRHTASPSHNTTAVMDRWVTVSAA
jgi:hypothetical protein